MTQRNEPDPSRPAPIVIAHRGVSGERPEHTRAAYELAVEQGCDYLEPDVVSTRDGVLVVRHENEISGTTDVADHAEFAARRTTKTIDGKTVSGWFTEDFTLDELRSLQARERLPELRPDNEARSGPQTIVTFDEVLSIAKEATRRRGAPVGVYVETKHPTYFERIGLDLNELLLADLEAHGMNGPTDVVTIQSMETGNLRRLRPRTPLPLIQLIVERGAPYDLIDAGDPRTYADLITPAGLAEIATYADGIGPHKSLVIDRDAADRIGRATGLVEASHAAGLLVHIWTMRQENRFLPADLRSGDDPAAHGDIAAEYAAYFDAGVDGVFTDFTLSAVEARAAWVAARA